MELSTAIVIALIVGAIAFLVGFHIGRFFQENKYTSYRIIVEKPSYMTDASMSKLLMEKIQVCMITENLVEREEDEDFKLQSFTFYIKDNG